MNKIKVCLTPALLPLFDLKGKIVVVTDVLRATSAMAMALGNGVEHIVAVSTLEEARAYKDKDYLIAAEREGEMVAGFDLGNSPLSYIEPSVAGKKVAITTTNGTKCIELAKSADVLITGAFVNLLAVIKFLREQEKDIIIACSGWKDNFSLEDTLFAGAVVDAVKDQFETDNDDAVAAFWLFQSAKDGLFDFIKQGNHYKRLATKGLEEDIRFCCSLNKTDALPMLIDGKLVNNSI
jgi:2-phosphosulfolactate phosphatase